jgi:hypothetical protein
LYWGERLKTSDLSSIKYALIHITIGGLIVFSLMLAVIVFGIWSSVFVQILNTFGYLGLNAFDETLTASQILMFGIIFLPSGFVGGLYVGYRLRENQIEGNPLLVLVLPSVVGFALFLVGGVILGYLNVLALNLATEIFMPLAGNIIGGYLGGYTMNWSTEEKSPELSEQLTIDLKRKPRKGERKKVDIEE